MYATVPDRPVSSLQHPVSSQTRLHSNTNDLLVNTTIHDCSILKPKRSTQSLEVNILSIFNSKESLCSSNLTLEKNIAII
jgi:hypothetical protein